MAGPGGPLNLAQAVASAAGALVLPALPQPVPVGAHVVVCGAIWRATDPGPIVVTDSRGTTYTVRPTATQAWSSGLSRGFLAHGRVTSAGSLVATITPAGGGSYLSGGVVEGALVAPASPEDALNEATGSSTAPSVDVTTLGDERAVLGLVHPASPSGVTAITPAADLMLLAKDESNAQAPWCLVWRRTPSAGALTLGWTLAPTRAWRALALALKPA